VRRIAVVGDSISFGYWVEERDAWPRQLQELLGPGVEVLNFGVPGYNLDQEIEVVRSRARRFGPEIVLVGFCVNDLDEIFSYEYGLTVDRASRRASVLGRIYDGLLARSVLFSFVEYRLTELEARRGFADAKNPLGGRLYEEAVAQQRKALVGRFTVLSELLKPGQTRGIVVVFPTLGNRFANYPHRQLHAAVTGAARDAGLEALDLVDCFSPYEFRDVRVDVVHPSPLGHRVAAHAVRDAVCGTGWPCPPVAGACGTYRPSDFRTVRGY
jgi:lysophospholipase L1-like esterase